MTSKWKAKKRGTQPEKRKLQGIRNQHWATPNMDIKFYGKTMTTKDIITIIKIFSSQSWSF